MKKKLIAIMLASLTIIGLVGCTNYKKNNEQEITETKENTTTVEKTKDKNSNKTLKITEKPTDLWDSEIPYKPLKDVDSDYEKILKKLEKIYDKYNSTGIKHKKIFDWEERETAFNKIDNEYGVNINQSGSGASTENDHGSPYDCAIATTAYITKTHKKDSTDIIEATTNYTYYYVYNPDTKVDLDKTGIQDFLEITTGRKVDISEVEDKINNIKEGVSGIEKITTYKDKSLYIEIVLSEDVILTKTLVKYKI